MAKVRALVLERQHELALRDIELPMEVGPDAVKVRIHTVGVCGSDVHYYTHGRIGRFVVKEPMVLGHEAAGTVRVHCDALGAEILARYADPIPVGTPVTVSVRPEKMDVHETAPRADNVAVGQVVEIAYLGDVSIYQVKTPSGAILRVQETHIVRSSEPHYDWDDTLYLSWEAGSAVVLPT